MGLIVIGLGEDIGYRQGLNSWLTEPWRSIRDCTPMRSRSQSGCKKSQEGREKTTVKG